MVACHFILFFAFLLARCHVSSSYVLWLVMLWLGWDWTGSLVFRIMIGNCGSDLLLFVHGAVSCNYIFSWCACDMSLFLVEFHVIESIDWHLEFWPLLRWHGLGSPQSITPYILPTITPTSFLWRFKWKKTEVFFVLFMGLISINLRVGNQFLDDDVKHSGDFTVWVLTLSGEVLV